MDNIFSERLMEVRESLGMTRKEFATYLDINPTNVTRYENSEMGVSLNAVKDIAEKLHINAAWLLGWQEERYLIGDRPGKHVPVLGSIAAGTPIIADGNIEDYEFVPADSDIDFCLRVRGDSMINARIYDGDIVCIKRQPDVETGEIAAVLIDGEEATLKRVYKFDGSIILRPENPSYKEMVFSKKDMKDVRIIGKAVWLKGDVK